MTRAARTRLRRLTRLPVVSPRQWLRRLVFWAGAVLIAGVAIGLATLADRASNLFFAVQAPRPWIALLVCPAGLTVSFLLTRYVFPGAQGSGIPQVIAAQHMTDRAAIARVLSPRIAAGQDRADPARPVLRRLDRPRGSDSADRRGHHARARPPAAPAAAGTGARAGAGRRRRRDRRRIQHAAGGRGIRHRGTQPFLRSTHLRHGADGGHRRRRHHLGAGRQLHLFRPYLGGAGFRPRLDRGGVLQPGGRPGRRIVQRGAGAVRTGVLRPVRGLAGALSGGVRRAVRADAGRDRHGLARPDLRHRLCPGARHGGGDDDAERLPTWC